MICIEMIYTTEVEAIDCIADDASRAISHVRCIACAVDESTDAKDHDWGITTLYLAQPTRPFWQPNG